MTGIISDFRGEHAYLSNFFERMLVLDGVPYASGEHAFNALKTLDPAQRETVRTAPTPGLAKAAGRRVTLQPDWDRRVRYEVMRDVTRAKYRDRQLRAALLATGDDLLIEGTGTAARAWHDQTWGQCFCERHASWPGANRLGQILMTERSRLRLDPADRWARVAVTGHRPQHLNREQQRFAIAELQRLAAKLHDHHGTTVAISGMALGADTWWAQAALEAGLDLWSYVPFEEQAGRWSAAEANTWRALRARASHEQVLGVDYDVRLLHARNGFMVRDADLVIAVADPSKTTGGTAAAMRLVHEQDKPYVMIDVVAMRTSIHLPQREPSTLVEVTGDLLADDAQMLVNPVNCVGVMGKGLARQFRERYPEMFESYRAACADGALVPGGVHVWSNPSQDGPRWVANVATKNHWRDPSDLQWVRDGARALAVAAQQRGVTSMAVPALGAGLGGLDWQQARAAIVDELVDLTGTQTRLYAPAPSA